MRALMTACLAVLAQSVGAMPPAGQEHAMLRTLRSGHPRLVCTGADFERAGRLIRTDPLAIEWHARLRAEGEKILGQPTAQHVLIGPRLLSQSRAALHRVYTLSALYRLDGDRRFLDRARKELLAVCSFPDWNPSHFLDVAEMTHAVAIGYDWLYDDLSPEDRATLRGAIVRMGLEPSRPTYEKQTWWAVASHNWNQVCNGGMAIGALAVADEEPEVAEFIVRHAVASLPRAMASYAPDGGWAEGPGYWTYATEYTVYALAGLESALGTDFGLSRSPGFSTTAAFRLQFEGPFGRTFNFADAGDRAGPTPALFWLARRFRQPVAAWLERAEVRTPHALDLLWFRADARSPSLARQPLDARYKGIHVATFRGAWEDPDATCLAVKGGDNAANHSHLDLGTFVLDALGQRWAVDLGSDDYNLPGYFGKQRFTYYRLKSASHNIVTLDGANQPAKAVAPITSFSSKRSRAQAVIDLSQAFPGGAARRGVALLDRRNVLIQDEVDAAEPSDILWTMHTPAEVTLDGARATLRHGGVYLHATVLSPAGARFEVLPTLEKEGERPNTGIRRLVVRVPKTANATIAVLLSPSRSAGAGSASPAVVPLEQW